MKPDGPARQPATPLSIGLSVRLYTLLLAAYPGPFRAEYGPHMRQVFRDACRRDHGQGGLTGMARLWARTALDLARSALEEHTARGIPMDRRTFVRWSGWVLGAAVSLAGFLGLGRDGAAWWPSGGASPAAGTLPRSWPASRCPGCCSSAVPWASRIAPARNGPRLSPSA
jgi:hypothetical protein